MLPIINLGPLVLPVPALILLIGFWLGLDLAEKQAARYKANASAMNSLVLVMLLAGVIGARLVYAAQAPAAFLKSPLSLLALSPQMFDVSGGVMVAVLAGGVYILLRKLPLWPTLDALVSMLSVLAVTLGLSHAASGEAFGAPSDVPWSLVLWGEARHPSQFYETLAALTVAVLVWPGARLSRPSEKGLVGFRFWIFLALSAGCRLFLETFRGDSLLIYGFRAAQLAAWVVLAVSLWQVGRRIQPTSLPDDAMVSQHAQPGEKHS